MTSISAISPSMLGFSSLQSPLLLQDLGNGLSGATQDLYGLITEQIDAQVSQAGLLDQQAIFTRTVSQTLGIEPDKVKQALQSVAQSTQGQNPRSSDLLDQVAQALGVKPQDLQGAIRKASQVIQATSLISANDPLMSDPLLAPSSLDPSVGNALNLLA